MRSTTSGSATSSSSTAIGNARSGAIGSSTAFRRGRSPSPCRWRYSDGRAACSHGSPRGANVRSARSRCGTTCAGGLRARAFRASPTRDRSHSPNARRCAGPSSPSRFVQSAIHLPRCATGRRIGATASVSRWSPRSNGRSKYCPRPPGCAHSRRYRSALRVEETAVGGFDNPRETWNARYAIPGYLFGEAPNEFLRRAAHWIKPRGSVLCVADGEGRNSVWLAEQGFVVTAFDFAPNALAKARALAERRGVSVDYCLNDVEHWPWKDARYDAIAAIFIQFLPPETRDAAFAKMRDAVEPGGLVLLQGYRPEQVDYGTGGPPRREHMYTRGWIESQFADWEIVALNEYDAIIREGQAHSGMSALIDVVARKRPLR